MPIQANLKEVEAFIQTLPEGNDKRNLLALVRERAQLIRETQKLRARLLDSQKVPV